MNLDSRIDTFLTPIANKVSGVIFSHVTINGVRVEFLIALLIIAAVYFTLRTRFIGFWGFRHAFDLLTQKYKHQDIIKRKRKGEVSSFQALAATISASAGMGNIVGSALAVSIQKAIVVLKGRCIMYSIFYGVEIFRSSPWYKIQTNK